MDELKSKCNALARRLSMLADLPENPWMPTFDMTPEMIKDIEAGLERGFRESLPLGHVPAWAAPLKADVLVDWHDALAEDDPEALAQNLSDGDYAACYLRRKEPAPALSGPGLAEDPLFLKRLESMAQLLTQMVESGECVVRVRPEWFWFHGDRIWANWDLLDKNRVSPDTGFIQSYETGWMHPGLRKREIPKGFSLETAASHSFAYLILFTLTRMPPARTLSDFAVQVDRFRAYNPELSPLLRPFFRKWLLGKQQEGTPLDCWLDLDRRLSDIRKRRRLFLEGTVEIGGDSAFGRNKRKNDNEDILLFLDGLSSDRTLAGVADGVSTASIGSGWAASATIKKAFQFHESAWGRAIGDLPAPYLSPDDWETGARAFLNDVFTTVHQAVTSEINQFAAMAGGDAPPSGSTMSSTLALVLCAGNQVMAAHWGDSRVYLVAEDGLVRLTEDHNRQLQTLAQGRGAGKPFKTDPEKDGHLIRAVGACRWSDDAKRYDALSLDQQPVAVNTAAMKDGEGLIVCSDGLLSGLSGADEEEKEVRIGSIFQQYKHKGPREVARRLVRAADEDQGDDNISVVAAIFRAFAGKEKKDHG